ncbi:MAG TPA: outer membrane lipid asymmetry maintenance protein MlaD [Candidatus Limnocylindria bacterium]|nr:outer membrane lipid asymmetry maintenance protein MlaD [Candidatus Limnocylindria bacterium]
MGQSSGRDLAVGCFVLLGLAAIAYLSVTIGGLGSNGPTGLRLVAHFDEIGGLKPRAAVVISGVKVGQVESITLGEDYRARVVLNVDPSLALPVDSTASIMTAGVLGDRYVSLQLGGETEILKDGDAIDFTESAVVLERVLGKIVHNVGGGDDGDSSSGNGKQDESSKEGGE